MTATIASLRPGLAPQETYLADLGGADGASRPWRTLKVASKARAG
jgi:hypothetical protein